jgi:hypothetical protein
LISDGKYAHGSSRHSITGSPQFELEKDASALRLIFSYLPDDARVARETVLEQVAPFFFPSATSPVLGKGTGNVPSVADFDDTPLNAPPSLGAYQYVPLEKRTQRRRASESPAGEGGLRTSEPRTLTTAAMTGGTVTPTATPSAPPATATVGSGTPTPCPTPVPPRTPTAAPPPAINTDKTVQRLNYAAASRGAKLFLGATQVGAFLLDEARTGDDPKQTTPFGSPFVLDLGQARTIDTIEFRLYTDQRTFRYRIDGSLDGTSYTTVVDRGATGEYRGRQVVTFPARSIRYLRFDGTFSSDPVETLLYLTDEIVVSGPSTTTATASFNVVIDGKVNAGPSSSVGKRYTLNAGIYEVRFSSGGIAPIASSPDGKIWEGRFNIAIPAARKEYEYGYTHPKISRFTSQSGVAPSLSGKVFTILVPFQTNVFFWFKDDTPTDNAGTSTVAVSQVSGANNTMLAQVRDAIARSVAWQQRDVAHWDRWMTTTDRNCFGCHTQSQASIGLNAVQNRLPQLPVDSGLSTELVSSYLQWLLPEGVASPHTEGFRKTQTSLWAWAASTYGGTYGPTLRPALIGSLDFLLSKQEAAGGWSADHVDANGAKLWFDGTPSAAHTAGNTEGTVVLSAGHRHEYLRAL